MEDQTTYETIERYLSGDLQGRERAEFEARLAREPELKADLELHRGLNEAIGDAGAMGFLEALESAEQTYLSQDAEASSAPGRDGKVLRPAWRQSYSIAAAVLLLFVVGGILLLSRLGGNSPEQLYDEYFAVYDGPSEWRSTDPILNIDLKSAFDAYNAKNFDAALKGFQFIEKHDSANVAVRFYLSMSAMATGDLAQAIPRLQALADQDGHSYRSQSRWYLALAFLKQGDQAAATPLLKTLAEGTGKYPELARELLAKL